MVELQRIDESNMTDAQDGAIRRLLCVCFPDYAEEFARCRCWHDVAPAYCLVHRSVDAIVSHVGIVIREIICGSVPIVTAGIQSFCVAPEFRGTGLSHKLMTAALEEAKSRGIAFGLLFCAPPLERFYASLGWVKTEDPVTMADETGRSVPLTEKNLTMFIEFTNRSFPPGPIDLQGRDW